MPPEVAARAPPVEAALAHERHHIGLLPGADLEHDQAAWSQHLGEPPCKDAIGREPVITSVQREARIVLADRNVERLDIAAADIGHMHRRMMEVAESMSAEDARVVITCLRRMGAAIGEEQG